MSPIQADIEYVGLAPALGDDEEITAPAILDFNAIGQLLDEVRRAGGVIPARYYPEDDTPEAYTAARKARDKLWRKISLAFTWEKLHPELTSEARQKNRPEVAKRIKGQARRLSESLQEDSTLTDLMAMEMGLSPLTGVGMRDFAQFLKALEKAAGKMAKGPSRSEALLTLSMTAQVQLIQGLAEAYSASDEGLDADPKQGIVRKGNESRELIKMQGPFVSFVRCAYALAKKPALNEAALCKALQRAEIIG